MSSVRSSMLNARHLGLAIICLLTFSGTITFGAVQQQFETTPSSIEVNPGSKATLTCKVRNRNGECFWLSTTRLNQTSLAVVSMITGKYEFSRGPTDGDCSIHIFSASLAQDDGSWECQVSQGSVDGNMLKSEPVKLTVRHPPLPPTIEHHSKDMGNVVFKTGDNFVTEADVESIFYCISRKGNPPAKLLWFVDIIDISNHASQINESDSDLPKTWRAKSSLKYTFNRKDHGKILKCVAKHDAYNTGSMDVAVSLNVSYKPEIKLEINPSSDLEEGQSLTLTCVVSANPPATIIWEKSGNQNFHFDKTIEFKSIKRSDSGPYSCSAKNSVGDSPKETVTLDVKFKPKVLRLDPSVSFTAELYQQLRLTCEAEGNPKPTFTWLQSVSGQANTWQHRGNEASLFISNLTFSYQGKYICEVFNIIHGKKYDDQSKEINLDVVGPPQAIQESDKTRDSVVVEKDDNAILSVIFCSDPKPVKMFWEWGSVKLDLGQNLARYISKDLTTGELPQDCHEARLVIQNVETSDSRKYTFHAENEKGNAAFDVLLQVQEPVTVSAVVGIVVGSVIVIVMIVIVAFYLLRKERCFLRSQGFHPESENSSRRLSEELQHNGHSPKDRAIPPDALYTDVQNVQHYENLKPDSRRNGSGNDVVYADLDLPALQSERALRKSKPSSQERIEYAEIQFKPSTTTAAVEL